MSTTEASSPLSPSSANLGESKQGSEGTTTPVAAVKTVYLVRHAESEENRRLGGLKSIGSSLMGFSFPTSKDIGLSLQLLNIPGQVDTPVSEEGRSQISNVADQLRDDNFWERRDIQLVAYSPLQRTRDTAAGLLRKSTSSSLEGSDTVPTTSQILDQEREHLRVVEVKELLEKTPAEWIPGNSASLYRRISELEAWLWEQTETKILCVGHSQFFKAMLRLDFKFGNCDVWQVELDLSKKSLHGKEEEEEEDKTSTDDCDYPNVPPQWSNLKRLYQIRSLLEEKQGSEHDTEPKTKSDTQLPETNLCKCGG